MERKRENPQTLPAPFALFFEIESRADNRQRTSIPVNQKFRLASGLLGQSVINIRRSSANMAVQALMEFLLIVSSKLGFHGQRDKRILPLLPTHSIRDESRIDVESTMLDSKRNDASLVNTYALSVASIMREDIRALHLFLFLFYTLQIHIYLIYIYVYIYNYLFIYMLFILHIYNINNIKIHT